MHGGEENLTKMMDISKITQQTIRGANVLSQKNITRNHSVMRD
jgi:hypothetical protein